MVRLSIHTLPPSTHPSPSSYVPLRPAEVECVPHHPRFLSLPPSHREPFYIPGHEVLSPKIRSGEEGRTIVYTNQPGHEKYVSTIGQHLVSAPPLALYPGFLSVSCHRTKFRQKPRFWGYLSMLWVLLIVSEVSS